jgi:hypothetical protein
MGAKEKRPVSSSGQSGFAGNDFQQFLGDIWAFQPHEAFLGTAVAEKIDAAVPHDFLIDDGKLLMDVGFKQKAHASVFKRGKCFL